MVPNSLRSKQEIHLTELDDPLNRITLRMRKLFSSLLAALVVLGFSLKASAQIVSFQPFFPTVEDSITITFNADAGGGALRDTQTVFIHTGLVTTGPTGTGWVNVQGNWGTNDPRVRMTNIGNNLHRIKVKIRDFYVYPTGAAFRLGMVFRNRTGNSVARSETGTDIFVNLTQPNQLAVRFIRPGQSFVEGQQGVQLPVEVRTSTNSSIVISADGATLASGNGNVLNSNITLNTPGRKWVKVTATAGNQTAADSFLFFVRKPQEVAPVPQGWKDGINYLSSTSVGLVLFAPQKDYVFLIGDFNDWILDNDYLMKRTADGNRYWIQLNNLTAGSEVGFQYLVDGNIRIGDPYSDLILDEDNDRSISSSIYPNMKPFPTGKTRGRLTVLQPGKPAFNWQVPNFQRPAKTDLVVYELWVRDFTFGRDFRRMQDSLTYLKRLGVNCIELMPVTEFEGNYSWGYNPSYHQAIDKAYGTIEDFKRFVDACHREGIAVVLDVVFNHGFSQSPIIQLYWNSALNRPSANSPYANEIPRHPFNVGYDLNHDSPATQQYFKQICEHLLREYKLDGFRFDLSKGFTQVNSGNDVGAWGRYDQSRVNLWKQYYDHLNTVTPGGYYILEHFAENSEERELANYGLMFWGNMTNPYNEATMGWTSGSDISWGYFGNRNWNEPNLLSYMESHDEERLMVRNLQFGNATNPAHNTRDLDVAINRMKQAAAFFFTIPGPKMIWQFGELGFDFSINWCENGTINPDCRTGSKPIRWNYYQQNRRRKLFETYAALTKLKTTESIFRTRNLALNVGGTSLKSIRLTEGNDHVVVVGNFAVTAQNFFFSLPRAGRYYDFFSGDSVEVTNPTNYQFSLQPGEFRIWSTKRFFTPPAGILTSLQDEVAEIDEAESFNLFPNPSTTGNGITVRYFQAQERANTNIVVVDMMGRQVYTENLTTEGTGTQQVRLNNNFAKGNYYVQVTSGARKYKKMIVVE